MKQLEISAEKAQEREEKLLDKIHTLLERLKVAEARFEYGEMNISKLNLRYTNIHFPDTNHISCGQILCMKNGNAYMYRVWHKNDVEKQYVPLFYFKSSRPFE